MLYTMQHNGVAVIVRFTTTMYVNLTITTTPTCSSTLCQVFNTVSLHATTVM